MGCISCEDLAYCDDRGVAGCIAGTTVVAWIHEPNIIVSMRRDRSGDDGVIGEEPETLMSPILFIDVMVFDRWSNRAD